MENFKKHSKNRENRIAKEIGGRSHPGSGSVWYKKGDVSNANFLIEDKFTVANSYSIQLSVIDRVTQQAKKELKVPILSFGFELPNNKLSFACIESKYLIKTLEGDFSIETQAKSKVFSFQDLAQASMKSGSLLLGELIFYNPTLDIKRIFYIFRWEDFIESLHELFPEELLEGML